jgi:hypothetical protein
MFVELAQSDVNQGGINWQNRHHGQDVQCGPMVGRLRTNLVTVRDANLAALCGFRVRFALALKAAFHLLRALRFRSETVQRDREDKSKQDTDRDVDRSPHPLRC